MSFPKYYLNGIDWITQALHYLCRKTASGDNNFVIAIELEDSITVQELSEFLNNTDSVSDILSGKTVRQKLHLAPYWKCSKRKRKIRIEHLVHDQDAVLKTLLGNFSNKPFLDKYEHFAVCLISLAESSLVLFKFDHRLFDGIGAELFLDELNIAWEKKNPARFKKPNCLSPQLSQWANKFDSGKNVNRVIRQLSENKTRPFFTFHTHKNGLSSNNRFEILHIPQEDTTAFFNAGEEELGAFMNTPFLSAVIFNALAQTASKRNCNKDDFILLPMTVDLRPSNDRKNHVFFNQWSIAPFCLSMSTALKSNAAMISLKKQFIELIKNNFLSDLNKANLLMRIIPLSIYSKVSANIFAGTSGSCSFAFLSDTGFKSKTLAGKKIKNLYHLPIIPPKPGLGIFINKHNEGLNIILSYRDKIISKQEVENLLETLQNAFKINYHEYN